MASIRASVLAGSSAENDSHLLTMSHHARARLRALFENVTMALCHDKVYAHVRNSKQEEDARLDRVLQAYEESRTSLSDFLADIPRSLRRPGRLDACIKIFGAISAPDATFSEVMRSIGSGLRTPLETLDIIKNTIEAIGEACVPDGPAYSHTLSPTLSSSSHKSRFVDLSTDELLPILSFIVVKSGVRQLSSLLSYINLFHMGEGDVAKLR
jgi:Vacuolar sorting protein 9 (VPS9) domain